MPRIISEQVIINELTINDNVSNSQIRIFFRDPTTKERIAYDNETVKRKGRKVIFNYYETNIKYGAKIMTGFRDGDFVRMVDGKQKAISSNHESPDYMENWKDYIMQHASDIIAVLGGHVFGSSADIEEKEEDEQESGDDAEKN